jgi:signal transduction histidine kinase
MTLPDVRRLLQVIFAPEIPAYPEQHAINLSEWRQERNRIARECHAKARKQRLRNTG